MTAFLLKVLAAGILVVLVLLVAGALASRVPFDEEDE